ncbi:MAG TPA: ABC transporter permease [Aldersonia sp.]
MTTVYAPDATLPTAPPRSTHRLLQVARLHSTAYPVLIAWPVGIVAVSFAIAYTIFFLVGETGNDTNFTGGLSALYCFAMVFYIQAMTLTFPFALGLNVTRREYFTATTLVALVQSAVFGSVLYLLALVERATDGWGVRMRMFDIPAYFTDDSMLQWSLFVFTLLFIAGIGMFVGAVYQRWRTVGLMILGLATLLALGGGAILITWQRWWPAIGSWFVDTPRVVTLVLLPAALAAVALAGTWGTVRQAMTR